MKLMKHSYKTIATKGSQGTHHDRGSKFLAFAYQIHSEEDARIILEDLKKNFHTARHHCYAWILGEQSSQVRTNDDGEPSGTAGKPILGQIRSFGLTNVMVVVVRYFGGTLLGTGGLIKAYKNAARNALDQARIITIDITRSFSIHFPYASINDVMRILTELKIKPLNEAYHSECRITVEIPMAQLEIFRSRFRSLPLVQLKAL